MKIAITGGAGFIGKATANAAMEAGHNVTIFDRPNDIMGDLSALRGAQTVIHLAGILGTSELFDEVERAIDINIKGTYRILDWCHRNGAGYVGIAMPDLFPSVYTATKIAAMKLATSWHMFRGVPVSHVRAFNAFGPGQKHGPGHPQKFLPTFATKGWHNEPLPIWGDGTQTMDMIHVDDLARMLVDAVHFGDDQVFDGGTGVPISVNFFADVVLVQTQSTGGIEYLPMRDGEIPQKVVATGEGWDLLGWKPRLSWDQVDEAIASYKPVIAV